jgi:hypothetical protein
MAINVRSIPIREAFEQLRIGSTKGYELVATGELRTYLVGDRRFTTPKSISDFIAKREAEETAKRSAA